MKINSFIQYAQFSSPLKAAAVVPAQSKISVSKWSAIKAAFAQLPELKPANTPPQGGGTVTTLALGEETGGLKPAPVNSNPGSVTTLALGEETGGLKPAPVNPNPGNVTTLALGEESGGLKLR